MLWESGLNRGACVTTHGLLLGFKHCRLAWMGVLDEEFEVEHRNRDFWMRAGHVQTIDQTTWRTTTVSQHSWHFP